MVNTTTFLSDSVLLVRNTIRDNVTDPIAAKRSTAGNSPSKFVMTSYPQRATEYPIITTRGLGVPESTKLGARSSLYLVSTPIEVRIWARNEKEKIELSEQTINVLRSNQISGDDFVGTENLFDFQIISSVPVDEEGKQGIKSQVNNINFQFILGA